MISYQDVLDAAQRIQGHVLRTPLLRIPALDESLGCQVYLKPENFQHTGSFKLRGASNRLLAMSEEEKSRGVVCASSGNHAQGVACAAQRLGVDAVIVMPTNCNPVKLSGVQSFGATVLLEGTLSSQREAKADELVQTQGRTIIPPYDDDYVRAGQGTMGLEIIDDEPEMDVIVVPIGGGGLISGVATGAKGRKPSVRMVGAEPLGAARYTASFAQGALAQLDSVDTIADGTRTDHANPNNFAIIQKRVDKVVTATEESIRKAMYLMVSQAHLVAEPSSVLGIAAVLDGQCDFTPEDKVCFLLSGGNNDLSLLTTIIQQEGEKK